MTAHHPSKTIPFALGLAAVLASAPAFAEPSPEDKSLARDLGTEGVKLADAGDCVGAIEKLEKAEALYHAPTILGRLGECQVKVGKLVIGSENLQKVVREDLGANPKPVFVSAQQRAKKVLDETLPRIGKLKITVGGACTKDVKVTVDGEPVAKAMLGESRPTDPGNHAIKAVAPGCLEATTSVQLGEGEAKDAPLVLAADPNSKPDVPKDDGPKDGPKDLPKPPKDTLPAEGGIPTFAWVALGVGAVGVVGGTVFGLSAMSKKTALDKACTTKSNCPESSRADIDSMKTSATVSTVGFVFGAVGLGVGVALIIVKSGSDRPPTSAWVQPTVGLGSVGLVGGF
ncbi:MAG: hypothetical protein IPJ34_09950 [Myxococcales bacterium]|nr:hypothetical protein [Myxococcales bacterium]